MAKRLLHWFAMTRDAQNIRPDINKPFEKLIASTPDFWHDIR
ncbi:MAG: hypothetical protein U0U67_12370 [Chitinophagales bacterium]